MRARAIKLKSGAMQINNGLYVEGLRKQIGQCEVLYRVAAGDEARRSRASVAGSQETYVSCRRGNLSE